MHQLALRRGIQEQVLYQDGAEADGLGEGTGHPPEGGAEYLLDDNDLRGSAGERN